MKTIKLLIIAIVLCMPYQLFSENSDTSGKAYYYSAKQHIENMLSGNEPISYEKAIFELENAWWQGSIDSVSYRNTLDFHVMNVGYLVSKFIDTMKLHPKSDLLVSSEQKKERYKKALINYSIYRYITKETEITGDEFLIHNDGFSYCKSDPMGTKDWTNTQVTNLLINHKGNCYALATLYKILSDRLNSDARLCTAPGHIYIRHADEKGTYYNVELSSRTFPGTGTLETITYTSNEATKNGISLRELDNKQAIALCLVYLAKGYEYKYHEKDNDFLLQCAESALRYDDHNLNAMLLKAEVMEQRLVAQKKEIKEIQKQKDFLDYQQWIAHIFSLGYREMPFEMKNILIKGWTKDTIVQLALTDHTPKRLKNSNVQQTRYASLSWGLFDEEMETKPFERYRNTVFDTKHKRIVAFLNDDILFSQYTFDPAVFALNVDPLAHKFPHQSPYCAFDNSPIWKCDPTGAAASTDVKENKDKTYTVVAAKNDGDNNIYKVDDKGKRTGEIVGQTLQPYDFMFTNDGTGSFTSDLNYGTYGPVTFDMNNLGISGTVHPNRFTTASISNANLRDLTSWGKGLFLQELARQSPLTFYGELEVLRDMSHNYSEKDPTVGSLDFKASLGLHPYAPVRVGGEGSTVITTLRAAGNLTFGANMFATKPALFGSNWYFSKVMPEVGKYNQGHNVGNGYNTGSPYYGEHTYSGSYIYWGYFNKPYKR